MPVETIELTNVGYTHGTRHTLYKVTAHIARGSYVGIVGPNGAGKTTLIQLIVGLLEPSEGLVQIFGKSVAEAQRSRIIGYVPQGVAHMDIPFPVSVEEVVSSGGMYSGKQVRQALSLVDMVSSSARLITQLSGGQRQRVFIARALVTTPSILVLDEPTTGVDSKEQNRFYELLSSLNKEQRITIIYVSHDLDVIARATQQVLCINGTLVCAVPARDLLAPETLRSLYGDRMSMITHHHAPHH